MRREGKKRKKRGGKYDSKRKGERGIRIRSNERKNIEGERVKKGLEIKGDRIK